MKKKEEHDNNNKDNIELFINGDKIPLTYKYKLSKGTNIVKIIIKNKINNLSHIMIVTI